MQLAAAHGFLGELQRQTSQMEEARESYAVALDLYDGLLEINPMEPGYRAESARVLYNLGILQKDTAGAENDPEREARLNQARSSLGRSIENLLALVREYPNQRLYALHLARSYINLGSVMRLQRALRKGRTPYRLAIAELEDLADRYPNLAEYRSELAKAHMNLGNLLQDDRRHAEAVAQYRLAESSYQRLVDEHPKVPLFRQDLANTFNSLGAALYRAQDLEGTREAWEAGIRLYEQLVQDDPDFPDYRGGLGMTRSNLGYVLLDAGHDDATTLHHLESGLAELRTALEANPEEPSYLASARMACGNLALLLHRTRKSDEALKVGRDLLADAETDPVDAQLAAVYLARILKEMESDKVPSPAREEFHFLAGQAVKAFRKTPEGESALRTRSQYKPLRMFWETP
jgi:tetratricopeptide (TPR) repeat protein